MSVVEVRQKSMDGTDTGERVHTSTEVILKYFKHFADQIRVFDCWSLFCNLERKVARNRNPGLK